jgi:hypothetical protein
MTIRFFLIPLLASLLLPASSAHAASQDEIQVNDDAIIKPGEVSYEIHLNTTPKGRTAPDYPGELTNNHRLRFTSEFSYGLTRDFEVALYLDSVRAADGETAFAGKKYRLKWMPLQADEKRGGWFAGMTTEYSILGHAYTESRDVLEHRFITGYKTPDWLFAVNPSFTWSLTDQYADAEPEFGLAVKYGHKVFEGLSAGVEYYGEFGPIAHMAPWVQQEQRLFAAVDVDMKPCVFNAGIGRGLTPGSDAWTLKTVIEVPVEELFGRGKHSGAGKDKD